MAIFLSLIRGIPLLISNSDLLLLILTVVLLASLEHLPCDRHMLGAIVWLVNEGDEDAAAMPTFVC